MDEKLLGKCGYYCGQCPSFIQGNCAGCVEGNKGGECYSRDCAMEKGILSCGYCGEFPCDRIQNDPKATLLRPLWLKWKAGQRKKQIPACADDEAHNRDLQVKRMDNCDWCNLSEEDRKYLLCESGYWSVFLADEQDYIGRCILVLKRHCGSMSELTADEWNELRELIFQVESCLKTVLGAAMFNWSCLMNSFYKAAAPDPHLHIHVRPRYDKPVIINGNIYSDSEFGHHYALHKSEAIPAEDREEVFIRLKERLKC